MELLTINYYTKAPGNKRRQIDDKARTRTKRMRNSDIDYFTDTISLSASHASLYFRVYF